jgi:Xaa-Pro dipeptidase
MNLARSLQEAETKALQLFAEAEVRGYICAYQTENQLNTKMYELAYELFGIKKYWHKRIVRSGANTLLPYKDNPPNLTIQADDILFFDFGPVFEEWEADFGRTYVIGNDANKIKIKTDIEAAWHIGHKYFKENYTTLTGADLYKYICDLAISFGWQFGNEHCGHLIGIFPHEKLQGEKTVNYIHPHNNVLMSHPDDNGNARHWILEIHFVDLVNGYGGFFEQYLF